MLFYAILYWYRAGYSGQLLPQVNKNALLILHRFGDRNYCKIFFSNVIKTGKAGVRFIFMVQTSIPCHRPSL